MGRISQVQRRTLLIHEIACVYLCFVFEPTALYRERKSDEWRFIFTHGHFCAPLIFITHSSFALSFSFARNDMNTHKNGSKQTKHARVKTQALDTHQHIHTSINSSRRFSMELSERDYVAHTWSNFTMLAPHIWNWLCCSTLLTRKTNYEIEVDMKCSRYLCVCMGERKRERVCVEKRVELKCHKTIQFD